MQQQQTALIWFTNNLRTIDNATLFEGCKKHQKVIAVYCFNPNHFKKDEFGFIKTEKFRAEFLIASVKDLKARLKKLNITLLIFLEEPSNIIPKISKQYNIESIYTQKEFTSEETNCIKKVKNRLPKEVKIIETYNQFLYEPENTPFAIQQTPITFSNFRKKIEKYGEINPELFIEKKDTNNLIENESKTPTLLELGLTKVKQNPKSAFPFLGGETEALKRIDNYFFATKKISFYKQTRNGLVGKDYSSKLSPWLANGNISAKTIYWKLKKYEDEFESNQSTYWLYFELLWRDFFKYTALKHENKLFKVNGIQEKEYIYKYNKTNIENWINGTTSEPFVNANMIELKETGWMSNRGRQNVASYFTKELHQDWRIGASYFESMLLDYDVHSNYGNWQYVAGVGNDPRNRKFNIKLQAERYDKNNSFRKLWLQTTLF